MEKCVQCKKLKDSEAAWKCYFARYHEVEIQHYVCPQCSILSFPKFYRLHEDRADNIENDSFGIKDYLISIFNKNLTKIKIPS